MDLKKIPIVPQWNITSGSVCTPDGGLLYVALKSINYIGPCTDDSNKTPDIRVFQTRQVVKSIDVDPGWGQNRAAFHERDVVIDTASGGGGDVGDHNVNTNPIANINANEGKKLFAALAADNAVQIWDFNKACVISGHKAHIIQSHVDGRKPHIESRHVLLSYMCNNNVLTMDENDIVVYCVASNTFYRRPTFISTRSQKLTIMRCCPFKENIFTVGTSRGLVLVCDLQNLQIIYTLRGHETAITSLAYTRIKLPTIEQKLQFVEKALQQGKTAKESQVVTKETPLARNISNDDANDGDIFNIYKYDYLENEFGVPSEQKKDNSDSEEECLEKRCGNSSNFNFVEACESLKEDIYAIQLAPPAECEEVTLENCKKNYPDNLYISDDESHSTLSISSECSSDYALGNCKVNIMHSAEVHEMDNLDRKTKSKREQQPEEDDTEIAMATANVNEKDSVATLREEAEKEKDDVNIVQPNILNTSKSNSSIESNVSNADILVASAAVDATVWVWNINIGASCDNIKTRSNSNGKNTNSEVLWFKQTNLIVNDNHGELSYWELQRNSNVCSQHIRNYKFKETKQFFAPQLHAVSINLCEKTQTLWYITSLREIICESLLSKKMLARYCSASTNITVMQECPHNMYRIALGFSDRRIGVLDMAKWSPTNVYIDNFSKRIDAQVTALVWSPDCMRLAFGTSEGRIGIVVNDQPRGTPVVFNAICGKPIYAIEWQENKIFAVCNQQIAVFNENAKNKHGKFIPNISDVSTLSVRENFLFVGTQNGYLKLYEKVQDNEAEYTLIQDLELSARYISCVSWYTKSLKQLALVAHSHFVYILNFEHAQKPSINLHRKLEIQDSKTTTNWVKWSNSDPNILLTCSSDGAVRIWDLAKTEKNPLKFVKQFQCPMNCGLFLPSDENIIICAGKYTSVEFFDMRTCQTDAGILIKKDGLSQYFGVNNIAWAVNVLPRVTNKVQPTAEKRRNRRAALQRANKTEIDFGDQGDILSDKLNEMQLKDEPKTVSISFKNPAQDNVTMRNCSTILYLTAKELNVSALVKLVYVLNSSNFAQSKDKLLCTKLLGTKQEAKQLLADEMKSYRESQVRGIPPIMAPIIVGDIKDEIKRCTQNKKLTEWHVSLAPTVSYQFWQHCCQAFAEQLMEQGHALQAATYLMAVHKPLEAIKWLLELNYHKEAMLIGRVHLQSDDPLLSEILESWIKYLEYTGNLVGASLICTVSGQTVRASELLERVRNPPTEIQNAIQLLKTK